MSNSCRRDYAVLLTAALAFGCSSSQLTLLAVVLHRHGMAPPAIADVASSLTAASLLGAIASGPFAIRFGAVRALQLGSAIAVLGIAVLPLTLDSVVLAAVANSVRGAGFGLLTASGQMFAQSTVDESNRTGAVAVFTAMFLLPAFFAPGVGEWSLAYLGERWFFTLVIAPVMLAVGAAYLLPPIETDPPPDTSGYLKLLRDRRLWLPNAATALSGLAYAFAWTFLPLMLLGTVPVARFFAPFAVAMVLTRFVGLKWLQRLPPPVVVGLGLFAYAVGFAAALTLVPACGVLFGFGYGVTLPSAIEWSTRLYPRNRRTVSLANTSFQIGSILAVQITGLALAAIGWAGVLGALGALVAAVFAIVAAHILAASFRGATAR